MNVSIATRLSALLIILLDIGTFNEPFLTQRTQLEL